MSQVGRRRGGFLMEGRDINNDMAEIKRMLQQLAVRLDRIETRRRGHKSFDGERNVTTYHQRVDRIETRQQDRKSSDGERNVTTYNQCVNRIEVSHQSSESIKEEQYIDLSHRCASLCEPDIQDEDNYDSEDCDENCLEIEEVDLPMQMIHLPVQQNIVKAMPVHLVETSSAIVSHEINSCMGDIFELDDHVGNSDPKPKLDLDVDIVLGSQEIEHSMCGSIREHPNRIVGVDLKKSFVSNKLVKNVESKSKDASLKFHDPLQEDATHQFIDFIGISQVKIRKVFKVFIYLEWKESIAS
ncbi:uncharacterized protein LOC121053078 [Rosa chinensis]|uniref:uncharacterized protein LOC121053078 n=1 Tax=Rosa chinensis TaxID=74649 RepID=UPI001AD8EA8F|nr:uncharacterized protein LOC121053078 [Rosa chinensis]